MGDRLFSGYKNGGKISSCRRLAVNLFRKLADQDFRTVPRSPSAHHSLFTAHRSLSFCFLPLLVAVSIAGSIAVWQTQIHSCINQSRD
jgi:hypothetical protein